jgi:hypothetical protein
MTRIGTFDTDDSRISREQIVEIARHCARIDGRTCADCDLREILRDRVMDAHPDFCLTARAMMVEELERLMRIDKLQQERLKDGGW